MPLEAAFDVPGSANIAEIVEATELQAVVRQAVRRLPESERIVVVLFYIGRRSLKEVAAFLEISVPTVKNRLHAARRRLRERFVTTMETTVEETIREQRLSKDERFRGQVIALLHNEYLRQFRENAQSADTTLLEEARAEMRAMLAADELPDAEAAHAGIRLLLWMRDFAAFPELMDRFRTRKLSPAEEFWARWTRIRGLAVRRDAHAVVKEQRELMAWLPQNIPGNPPIRLSAQEPFVPTDDAGEEALSPDTLCAARTPARHGRVSGTDLHPRQRGKRLAGPALTD